MEHQNLQSDTTVVSTDAAGTPSDGERKFQLGRLLGVLGIVIVVLALVSAAVDIYVLW